ncbi:hypothetical protein [Sulfoacidibacillus ferrooxidans]|uniref:MBG domain-containing protein n=1 Tax=Sulfoacidibacillus ferrooxidans TaxID=2005001 RepID=A0A9X2ACK5_9BACL|nr:hypothetical protein [Sulfoacidibacillus ferrooxidans]MCI0184253.1 hypothetical protein [Sulfoacidibacillus ferrooxidans]
MKKRWSIFSSLVLVSSLFASDGTAVFAQSYVGNGTQVGTAGTLGYYDGQVTILGSNGQPYQNGNNNTPFSLYYSTTTGLNTYSFLHAVFEYAPESVSLSGFNSGSGQLWHVDEVANNFVPVTSANGYLMISNTERSAWVNALNGNLAYVDQAESSSSIADGEEYDAEFQDKTTREMFPLYDFPAIVLDSGDELVSGSNGLGPVDVIVTPKPTASISASNPIIGQGHTETLTGTGTVSAYGTSYHYAGVSITNAATGVSVPQSDITFAGNDGEAPIQTPSGGTMYEMNTGDGSYSDTIHVNTKDLTAGAYSVTYDVSDYRDRFAPATTTSFTVRSKAIQPTPQGPLSLAANPTSTKVGQGVTLLAVYQGQVANDRAIYLHDLSGDHTLSGSNIAAGMDGQSVIQDSAVAQTAETVEYEAALELPNGTYIHSNPVYVTWKNASQSGGSGGGGSGSSGAGNGSSGGGLGSCSNGPIPQKPIEQVLEQSTSCTSQGYDKLTWVDTNWVLQATTHTGVKGVCTGDYTTYQWVDEPVTYDHIYVDNLQNLEISGLLMDPGVPGDPWSDVNQTATQVSKRVTVDDTITGQQLPTYTNPYAGVNGAPYVYVRPAGGFGFRILWTGSPFDVMQSMDVTFVMKNPDGTTRTWTETPTTKYPTNLDTATLDRVDIINPYDGANGYAPYAGQYASAYTPIPKYVNRLDGQQHLELAAWNMTGDASTAATITATITVNTNCGSVITTIPNIAQLFNDPTWYFIHQVPNSSVPQTGITWVKLYNDPTDGESMPTTPAQVNAQDAAFLNANPELKGP